MSDAHGGGAGGGGPSRREAWPVGGPYEGAGLWKKEAGLSSGMGVPARRCLC